MLCCLAKILPRENHPGLLRPSFRFPSWTASTSTKSFFVELLSLLRGPATSVQVFTVNFWLNLHFWYWPVLRTKQAFSSCLLAYWFLRLEKTLNHLLYWVPIAILEKHWWRSNNKTAVLKPWVRNKLVPRRSVDTCVCIMTIISKKKEKEGN